MTLGYTFNAARAFATARSTSAFGWSETFGFDNLDRLTVFNDNDGNHSQAYDGRGRISSNSRLGAYTYSGSSYQQGGLNLNTPADLYYQTRELQDISYNAFKSPVEIHEPGHDRYSFQYNGELERANMFYGSEAADKLLRPMRQHYSSDGSVEITRNTTAGTTSFVFYLGGDAYSAPAIWKETYSASPTVQNLYYLHRDYLGSIVMITDASGYTVEKRQFDAWGNIVRLQDGGNNNLPTFTVIDRGYTGHQHLLPVGLIHMNARLYDPLLGRFLSPDNYVQDPYGTQNFNRYGYALNNPLVYVDENGEFIWMIPVVAAAVFGVGNLIAQSKAGEINNFWDGLSAFGAGAVAGSLIGTGVATGLAVPILGTALKVAGWAYAGVTAASAIQGINEGINTGDWSKLGNAGKLFLGNFYLDGNRDFFGQFLQGSSRFSWEILQSVGGYGYSQTRNIGGSISRVDFLGGATFVTNEYARSREGISLGNYVNINIRDGIQGSFAERVISDPLFMHEYGHTFDS